MICVAAFRWTGEKSEPRGKLYTGLTPPQEWTAQPEF